MEITQLAMAVVITAVFFYVLYCVIRVAVRDGILAADRRRDEATAASERASQDSAT